MKHRLDFDTICGPTGAREHDLREGATMKTVGNTQFASISEAKAILPRLVEEQRPTVLLRHNEPVAVLVSIERYNDYLALETLVRHPALLDRLRARAEAARATPLAMLRTMEDLERLREAASREVS
jgi:PHD/YefM family antitoxin component YafN of YafNO toxin-antitoxin module